MFVEDQEGLVLMTETKQAVNILTFFIKLVIDTLISEDSQTNHKSKINKLFVPNVSISPKPPLALINNVVKRKLQLN